MTSNAADAHLLSAIGAPTEAFVPPHAERLSTRCRWYADDERLVLVTRGGGPADDAEHALAYGLAYSCDRDLWIVTSRSGADLIRPRIPWLSVPITVFRVDEGSVQRTVPLAKAEVLARFTDPLVDAILQLGDEARWIEPLVEWINAVPELQPAPRSNYLAWHCDGRQVLAVRRKGNGLHISAGVDATSPRPGDEPTLLTISGPMSSPERLRVIAAVARATADRLDGSDAGHSE